MARDPKCAPLIGRADEAEEKLNPGRVKGREAQLVDDGEIRAEQRRDLLGDCVVGKAPIQVLDQVRPRESVGRLDACVVLELKPDRAVGALNRPQESPSLPV